jgi:hypothetical protein
MHNTFKTKLHDTLTTLVAQREHWEHGVYKQARVRTH